MGVLTYVALAYGILFFLSLAAWSYLLTSIMGLLGAGLIIALSVKLDEVEKDAQENELTWTEIIKLKKEMQELRENKA